MKNDNKLNYLLYSCFGLIIVFLVIPFFIDYIGKNDEEISNNFFVIESVISKKESKFIVKQLEKNGFLNQKGGISDNIDLKDIQTLNLSTTTEREVIKILENYRKKLEKKQRNVEITDSFITGYDQSKLSWKIAAKTVYVSRSQYIFNAENIFSGFIYNHSGRIIIDSIQADQSRINTKRKTIHAKGNIRARFLSENHKKSQKRLNGIIADDLNSEQPITIKSDELHFNGSKDFVELSNNVEISQDDVTIYPNKSIIVDNNLNIATIKDGFKMKSETFSVSGNTMTIYLDEDRSEMTNGVTIIRQERVEDLISDSRESSLRKNKTILTCKQATYIERNDNHVLKVKGDVNIVQPGKLITADEGIYDEIENSYELKKNITIELDSLDWLIKSETKKNINNNNINSTVRQKTLIVTDSLRFKGDLKELSLEGNIKIVQPDKTIFTDKMIFDDKNSKINCIGKVKVIKKNKDQIETSVLEIDLENETFTAKKGVSSLYYLDK